MAHFSDELSHGSLEDQSGVNRLHVSACLVRVETIALRLEHDLVNVDITLRRELATVLKKG